MYSEKRVAYLNGYKMKENVDKHINSPILFNTIINKLDKTESIMYKRSSAMPNEMSSSKVNI